MADLAKANEATDEIDELVRKLSIDDRTQSSDLQIRFRRLKDAVAKLQAALAE